MKKAIDILKISTNFKKIRGTVLEIMAKNLSRNDIEFLNKENNFYNPREELKKIANDIDQKNNGKDQLGLIQELSRINESYGTKDSLELYHPNSG